MEAIPLAEISAQTCARAYATGIVARHGSSTYLITDKGTNFTSAFFNETCRILGVGHLNTSAYHPQANGSIERMHSTTCRSINHYINASGSNWDTLIPFYLMAYNSSPHTVTKFSPFYTLHGREPVLPTIQGHEVKLSTYIRGTDNEARLRQLHYSFQLAYRLFRKNIKKSHSINKNYYDRKTSERDFQKNDLVYLYDTTRKRHHCRKFWTPWSKLFRVVGRKNKLNYRIVSQQGKEQVVHVNRLMKSSDQTQWTPVRSKTQAGRQPAKQSKNKEEEDEEETEEETMTRAPIMVQTRHDEGRQNAQRTNRDQQFTDTPGSYSSTRASLDAKLRDPN
jgi:hypothetical protein